jgi:hypothetical protein
MAARIFAVFAALLLVASIAIGTLMPAGLTLGRALALMDNGVPGWLRVHSTAWLWNWLEVPFMVRPLWLIPAFLGLICAGMATMLSLGDASPRRRRS